MKCYFVRHGKTQWNLEGRFQGANGDSPLLKESIHDLEKLGDYLQDISFDAVFSSCLRFIRKGCRTEQQQTHAGHEQATNMSFHFCEFLMDD